MEAKSPSVLFYTSDFLTGTSNLTMEERGQYITLLSLQHQTGHLSKKIIDINVPNCSPDVIEKFLQDDKGLYYQHRMDEEIEKRNNYVDSRYENGYKGGRPKGTSKNNHMDKHKDNDMDNHIGNDNDNNIDNILDIYKYIERVYGRTITSNEYFIIEEWQKDFTEEMIKYAFDLSISNNAPKFNYVKGILNNWKAAKYKTLQEVKEREQKEQKKEQTDITNFEFDYDWLSEEGEEK